MQSKESLPQSEPPLAKDLQILMRLSTLLRQIFQGSSFGDLKIDDAVEALDRLVAECSQGKMSSTKEHTVPETEPNDQNQEEGNPRFPPVTWWPLHW